MKLLKIKIKFVDEIPEEDSPEAITYYTENNKFEVLITKSAKDFQLSFLHELFHIFKLAVDFYGSSREEIIIEELLKEFLKFNSKYLS